MDDEYIDVSLFLQSRITNDTGTKSLDLCLEGELTLPSLVF